MTRLAVLATVLALSSILPAAAADAASARGHPERAHKDSPAQAEARAFKELQSAASAGDAQAQLDLAERYATGKGVKPNPKQAEALFAQAAESGLVVAAIEFSRRLELGDGVARDPIRALYWLSIAAEQGRIDAQLALADKLLSSTDVTYDPMRAAHWLRRAADAGNLRALVRLGRLHQRGEGVPQNHKLAGQMFRQAADAGDPAGRTALAEILRQGAAGIDKNSAEGIRLLETAASQGFAPALYQLAMAHYYGVDASLDLSLAIQQMTQDADQGYPLALLQLGRFHLDGKGVAKDGVRAFVYFLLADQLGGPQIKEQAGLQITTLETRLTKAVIADAHKQAKEWRQLRGL